MGMVNDGTLAYDHQKDGSTQQLAGCLRDFRNKPFPVRARMTYYQNTFTVNIVSINYNKYAYCQFSSHHLVINTLFIYYAASLPQWYE